MIVTQHPVRPWLAGESTGVVRVAHVEAPPPVETAADVWQLCAGSSVVTVEAGPSRGAATCSTVAWSTSKDATGAVPRSALGRRLAALRDRAIQCGMELLTTDEVLEEVRRRRGEIDTDEADVP